MKIFKTLLVAAAVIALLSCSETNHPHIDNEAELQNQTRGETTDGEGEVSEVGMSAIITDNRESVDVPPINLVPNEAETDTIPSEELRNDSIPTDSIPNDSTSKSFSPIR